MSEPEISPQELGKLAAGVLDRSIKVLETEGNIPNIVVYYSCKQCLHSSRSVEVITFVNNMLTGNEATLIECCELMTTWGKKMGTEFSEGLLGYIPKGLTNLKGAARNAFCNILVVVFENSRISKVDSVLKPIATTVEKNTPQLFQVIAGLHVVNLIRACLNL